MWRCIILTISAMVFSVTMQTVPASAADTEAADALLTNGVNRAAKQNRGGSVKLAKAPTSNGEFLGHIATARKSRISYEINITESGLHAVIGSPSRCTSDCTPVPYLYKNNDGTYNTITFYGTK